MTKTRAEARMEAEERQEYNQEFLAAPYLTETYKSANAYMRTPINIAFWANTGGLLAMMASGQGGVLQRLAESAGISSAQNMGLSIAVLLFVAGIFLALFASLKSYIVLRHHIHFVLQQKGNVEFVPVSGLARSVILFTVISLLCFVAGTVIVLNLFDIMGLL